MGRDCLGFQRRTIFRSGRDSISFSCVLLLCWGEDTKVKKSCPGILQRSKHRMKIESTREAGFDAGLAHGLARVALGLNIAIHGYGRLPNLTGFASGMVQQFAATILPGPIVYITGLGIPIGEAVIGTLLFFGLFCRPTLVIGTLLMLLLIFGSSVTQQWEIASIQMTYVAFYAVLLATVRYDRFSLDGLRRRK
jgi:thiosulfate dehydrogenase [quinone] large subunit